MRTNLSTIQINTHVREPMHSKTEPSRVREQAHFGNGDDNMSNLHVILKPNVSIDYNKGPAVVAIRHPRLLEALIRNIVTSFSGRPYRRIRCPACRQPTRLSRGIGG